MTHIKKKNTLLPVILIALFGFTVFILAFMYFRFGKEKPESNLSASLPSFPGAEGFRTSTPGGRFGRIVIVTNLNDSLDTSSPDYPGSLRWALESAWPDNPTDPYDQRRIVIFKISGMITLLDTIWIEHPYVTIEGQTAPGQGIVIQGSPIFVRSHDVIVRGLRFRVGDLPTGANNWNRDGISVWGGEGFSVYNVVIDHNSVAWAVDENTSTWDTVDNVTFSWNIIAEGLNCSIHLDEDTLKPECHSDGMLIGQGAGNISVHHNLLASNNDRNPAIQNGNIELVNNVIYNFGDAPTKITGGSLNAVGNYYIATPGTNTWHSQINGIYIEGGDRIYLMGNIGPQRPSDIGNEWSIAEVYPADLEKSLRSDKPVFPESGIKADNVKDAYNKILTFAGAWPRDTVDARILENLSSRTPPRPGKWIIDSQYDVGGWPDYQRTVYPLDTDNDGIPDDWEISHGIDPNNAGDANSSFNLAPSGYPWIEEYSNSLIPTLPPSWFERFLDWIK